jgi:benzoyl-CoA reductase subunit C
MENDMNLQKNKEEELQYLINLHLPENLDLMVKKWKEQGKRVIGLVDSLFPEEIIYAAGIFPYRVFGTGQAETPLANVWRPVDTCRYCNHVLESLLAGELDFLDGIVFTDWDDDERRLYDVCHHLGKPAFTHIQWMPRQKDERGYQYTVRLLRRFITSLEETFDVKVTDDALWQAIELYDQMRSLLMQLYEWRKREVPPVTGAEAVGLVMASFFMPKEEYVKKLKSLMDYLEKRQNSLNNLHPRLLVTSDHLHNLGYLELVESEGALVAMDDLDTGSRYFWQTADGDRDPIYALARRYISRPADVRMSFWHEQVEQIIQWVRDYNIDGVLHLPHLGNYDRLSTNAYLLERLNSVGIPVMTFLREYHLANVGQLRTRVGAFLESLAA